MWSGKIWAEEDLSLEWEPHGDVVWKPCGCKSILRVTPEETKKILQEDWPVQMVPSNLYLQGFNSISMLSSIHTCIVTLYHTNQQIHPSAITMHCNIIPYTVIFIVSQCFSLSAVLDTPQWCLAVLFIVWPRDFFQEQPLQWHGRYSCLFGIEEFTSCKFLPTEVRVISRKLLFLVGNPL